MQEQRIQQDDGDSDHGTDTEMPPLWERQSYEASSDKTIPVMSCMTIILIMITVA